MTFGLDLLAQNLRGFQFPLFHQGGAGVDDLIEVLVIIHHKAARRSDTG